MLALFCILLFLLLVNGCKKPTDDFAAMIKDVMAVAYFEAQVDALEGEVKVQKVGDRYVWIKSLFPEDPEIPLVTTGDSLKQKWGI